MVPTIIGETFIERLNGHIANNLANEQFGVEQLASLLNISRSQLHRKLQKTCGKSTSGYIREYRLNRAHEWLLATDMSASEISFKTGFSSPSYFNRCFKSFYGYPPGETKQRHIENVGNSIGRELFKGGKSIMVMPFVNQSPAEKNAYLAHSMVEAISRQLLAINDLKVVSSYAVEKTDNLQEIGHKFKVATVMQGGLYQENGTLRVEVKLLNTHNGGQIWAQYYDRKSSDLLKVQSDIANKIAEILKMGLSSSEKKTLIERCSYHVEAYDYYMRGMYHMNQIGDNGIAKSLQCFKQAIAKDAQIAPAYAALANVYHMKASIFSASLSTDEAYKNAKYYLDKAVSLDKTWHFNYTMKGFQLTFFEWNFEKADAFFRKGLKSQDPLSQIMYRDFLQFVNRHEEAMELSLRIDRETPFYPNSPLIMPYYYSGLYEQGRTYIEERLSSFPAQHLTYDNAGFFMLNIGEYDSAISLFESLIKLKGKRYPRALGWMGAAYARMGDEQNANKILKELMNYRTVHRSGSPAWFIAIINAALGQNSKAINWIQKAIDEKELEVPWLVSEPQFFQLHGLTGFDALVKKVGFPENAYPYIKAYTT